MYKMFLDDERFAEDYYDDGEFYTTRSVEDAIEVIEEISCPSFISFDHDLGLGKTGMDFAKWLIEMDLDSPGFIPDNFTFNVHSANPVGRINIMSIMDNYLIDRVTL